MPDVCCSTIIKENIWEMLFLEEPSGYWRFTLVWAVLLAEKRCVCPSDGGYEWKCRFTEFTFLSSLDFIVAEDSFWGRLWRWWLVFKATEKWKMLGDYGRLYSQTHKWLFLLSYFYIKLKTEGSISHTQSRKIHKNHRFWQTHCTRLKPTHELSRIFHKNISFGW